MPEESRLLPERAGESPQHGTGLGLAFQAAHYVSPVGRRRKVGARILGGQLRWRMPAGQNIAELAARHLLEQLGAPQVEIRDRWRVQVEDLNAGIDLRGPQEAFAIGVNGRAVQQDMVEEHKALKCRSLR